MGLPKIVAPEYQVTLPSSKTKIKYRPFLVSEEKILLMAMESKDGDEMKNAVEQIIRNCTFNKCQPVDMAIIDIEYLFLQLRIKSKGNEVDYTFKCKECSAENNNSANLNKVKVVNKDQDGVIKITDSIGIKMKSPSYDMSSKINKDIKVKDIFDIIIGSIDIIYEGEEIYYAADYSDKDLMEFVESFSDTKFKEIQDFFANLPGLEMEIDFSCSMCKKENKITLKGLNDFLV